MERRPGTPKGRCNFPRAGACHDALLRRKGVNRDRGVPRSHTSKSLQIALSDILSILYKVVEQLMGKLGDKEVIGETLDADITKFSIPMLMPINYLRGG